MKTSWRIGILAAVLIGPPRSAVAADGPRTIEIALTAKGFEPSRVKVKKGEPLQLVVTRKTDDTCAREIVIPSENLRADLPLNKAVTLRFTPQRSGEIKYTCGLDMITGVIEVASRDGTDGRTGT
jgi:plastocyanin domain-containing protein